MVLLVTGRCKRRCCYCPLSAEKKGRDVFFANERSIRSLDEAIEEAQLMDALGTGITGGDPLLAIDRSEAAIIALKKSFGVRHHIHLYTASTDADRIRRVAAAGLDEIRFHPPAGIWKRLRGSGFERAIRVSMKADMKVGIEIPVLPNDEAGARAVIQFADDVGLDFVNLNELEFSETNWQALRAFGFDTKDDVSSGVMGSERLAMRLLASEVKVPLHYCSSSFKDGIQLRRRIMRRARNVQMPHELLTKDGTLMIGVVETPDRSMTTAWLMNEFNIPGKLIHSNARKNRLEVAPWVLEMIYEDIDLPSFIVEEYPTADRLEVERTPLRRR